MASVSIFRRPLGPSALATTALALVLASCSSATRHELQNVRPPHPGRPASAADVEGIYRSVHNGLLQLRGNGDFLLITPRRPSSGSYQLRDGRLEVRTPACGNVVGDYDVEVTGEPQPGKAVLQLTAVDDACDGRRQSLTGDGWVYANS
jgi:hypothetical protein